MYAVKDSILKYKLIILLTCIMIALIHGNAYATAQVKGQVLRTSTLDVTDKDFFSCTCESANKILKHPLELFIKEDTTLIIDGAVRTNTSMKILKDDTEKDLGKSSVYFLEGIRITPGRTLTIQLQCAQNFYLYGRGERVGSQWISHAGIDVPEGSTLIIEQISKNAGALIAVGGGNVKDGGWARGTGAGIGGCGCQFLEKARPYKCSVLVAYEYFDGVMGHQASYDLTNCGTVIIRSGTVYACGGCAINEDLEGGGAGIGGGGVYKNDLGGDDDYDIHSNPNSKIYSGKGGTIKIYGGHVEAYGGGTLTSNNQYNDKRDIFFNKENGFYVTNFSTGNQLAYGSGAGIGGGGLFCNNEPQVNMRNEMDFGYWGGQLYAHGGLGNVSGNNDSVRGGGSAIGGGGGYSKDKDHHNDDEEKVIFKSASNIKISRTPVLSNLLYGDGALGGISLQEYGGNMNGKKTSVLMGDKNTVYLSYGCHGSSSNKGEGCFIGTGGWMYKGNVANITNACSSDVTYEDIRSGEPFSLYIDEFPQEAFSDYADADITLLYFVGKENTALPNLLSNLGNYKTSITAAIEDAMGKDPTSFDTTNKKIYNEAGYKVFAIARIDEVSSIGNFGYTKGIAGIKSIKKGSAEITRSNLYKATQKEDNMGLFDNNKGVYEVADFEEFNSELYNDDPKYNICAKSVKICFPLNEQTTIKVTKLSGKENQKTTEDVSNYFVSKDPITITVKYGMSKAGPWFTTEDLLKASDEYKNANSVPSIYVKAIARINEGTFDKFVWEVPES